FEYLRKFAPCFKKSKKSVRNLKNLTNVLILLILKSELRILGAIGIEELVEAPVPFLRQKASNTIAGVPSPDIMRITDTDPEGVAQCPMYANPHTPLQPAGKLVKNILRYFCEFLYF
ncbi:MAG: hypothetical protein ACOYXB_14360, partial [Bacteroidota bacterium]